MIYAIKDSFLNTSMLKYAFKSYSGEFSENPEDMFLLNPASTPEHILAKFPSTRIMGGTYDPI